MCIATAEQQTGQHQTTALQQLTFNAVTLSNPEAEAGFAFALLAVSGTTGDPVTAAAAVGFVDRAGWGGAEREGGGGARRKGFAGAVEEEEDLVVVEEVAVLDVLTLMWIFSPSCIRQCSGERRAKDLLSTCTNITDSFQIL